ncbi:TIGR02453 family protein, partial [Obesumbacterium proteus]|nr:TIGR02453 family protein [Obesumbacterium proteus]
CCKAPFELVGDSYKRPLIKDQAPEIADWYNRKTFAVMATDNQVEQLFTPELATMLAKKLTKLAPLYQFLMKVEALKQVPLEDL